MYVLDLSVAQLVPMTDWLLVEKERDKFQDLHTAITVRKLLEDCPNK